MTEVRNGKAGRREKRSGTGRGTHKLSLFSHSGAHHTDGDVFSISLIEHTWNSLINTMPRSFYTQVKFEVGDLTKIELPKEGYDVIYSRDTILHIPTKEQLFKTFYVSTDAHMSLT